MCRMTTISFLLVLVLVPRIGLAGEATPAAAPEKATAQVLLQRALDLWHQVKDYNGALQAFNKAVEAYPEDPILRMNRAGFFETMSEMVVDKDKERFKSFAREDYDALARKDPDSRVAGIARDSLARMDGRQLFPGKSLSCPDEARQAYRAAEANYSSQRYRESVADYEQACRLCPDNAPMWVSHGDAYYGMKEYAKARALFLKAIEVDPWNRSAHGFLSDTEARLGNLDAAVRQAALAVISDPTCEAAWASLRQLSAAREGKNGTESTARRFG